MANFANLKRNRDENLSKITQELSKLQQPQGGSSNNEDLYWKPTIDKVGNGQAVIRFLPPVDGEDAPFVRLWDHGFQGPGGWYIEKSLTSVGEQDPLSEYNTRLWNSGIESDKEQARKQKRRLRYISNILVIKDSANPENEGKVFLYQYGKKIFDKLSDMVNPEFEDEAVINPFDFWEGANFKLRVRKVDGYPNYDKSEFEDQGAIGTDEEMEAIWKQQHSLSDIVARKNFKTYDELKTRLDKALGLNGKSSVPATKRAEDATPPWEDVPDTKTGKVTAPIAGEDEDDDISFFKKLAKDD